MAIQYRPAEPDDLPFILSSWLKSARNAERHSFMPSGLYFTYYRHRIIKLLASSFVRIAFDESQPNVILAFMVYCLGAQQELILHWVYVRKPAWNCGIAKAMIADVYPDYKTKPVITTTLCIFQCGYDSKDGKHVAGLTDKYPNLVYNPYALEAT